MNILLVEDDASVVSALTDLLHSEGFSVQACATQDAACEALARTTFDIALLDVMLPQDVYKRQVSIFSRKRFTYTLSALSETYSPALSQIASRSTSRVTSFPLC